jgi:hypothetical protein
MSVKICDETCGRWERCGWIGGEDRDKRLFLGIEDCWYPRGSILVKEEEEEEVEREGV